MGRAAWDSLICATPGGPEAVGQIRSPAFVPLLQRELSSVWPAAAPPSPLQRSASKALECVEVQGRGVFVPWLG